MVRLALVSDTHLPQFGRRLPVSLVDALHAERPDAILHLGDHTADFVVAQLEEIAPVEAVAGNNDPAELVERFGLERIVALGTLGVGLTHGHRGRGATTPDRASSVFADVAIDVIAFGHSHIPLVEWRNGRLLVNPGSPTDRRRQPAPTFALLTADPGAPPTAWIVGLPVQPARRLRVDTMAT